MVDDFDMEGFDGVKFVCLLLLWDKVSQEVCWEGMEQGVFDFFLFDYCFFCFDDFEGKLNEKGKWYFCWILNGIFGVVICFLILFFEGVMKG